MAAAAQKRRRLPVFCHGFLLRLLDRESPVATGLAGLACAGRPWLAWHGICAAGDSGPGMWAARTLARLQPGSVETTARAIEPLGVLRAAGLVAALALRAGPACGSARNGRRWSLGLSLGPPLMVFAVQTPAPDSLLLDPPSGLVCAPVLASILSWEVTGLLASSPLVLGLLAGLRPLAAYSLRPAFSARARPIGSCPFQQAWACRRSPAAVQACQLSPPAGLICSPAVCVAALRLSARL